MATSIIPRHPLPTPVELVALVETALRQFGEHTFNNRGPVEVMDIENLVVKFRGHPPEDAARALRSFAHSGDESRKRFNCDAACAIVIELEGWDELIQQPGMMELYNLQACGMEQLYNLQAPLLLPGDAPVGAAVAIDCDSSAAHVMRPVA